MRWRLFLSSEDSFYTGESRGTTTCLTVLKYPPPRTVFAQVGKLWMRLMPGVIFCYVLLVAVGVRHWYNFPFCLLSAGEGTGINRTLIGWGDWYVEVYFILSVFFISLFHISRKSAWLWICTLTILCWCVQMNNKPGKCLALGGMYYGALAYGIVRGFTCMTLGMVASCLSNVWNIKERLPLRIIATVYEAVALFMLFNYMYRTSRAPYSPIAMEFVVAMLLVSATHSWGYLSKFLNRISGVMWFSRYTYSLLLSQATLCSYFGFHHKFNLPYPTFPLVIFGAAIPLTLIEYHFVERWLVPKLKACFQNTPNTNPGG